MKDENIKKVLLLGSGALKIGEAGEFDYSGSQALKALREEGVSTVLINPNIATVQTSEGVADQIYFLPVQPYFVERVIEKERPDGILLSFGGQTALNCGVELYRSGVLDKYNVKVLGTPVQAIMDTEDRELFVEKLREIKVNTISSEACENIEQTRKAARELGYPVIIRAAYALGGLGSGFADNEEELNKLAEKAFSFSPQVLVEKSLKGWKEIEYEVVRDRYDNCITVCNMENFDPLGIHTGESIVIAPSQTLTNSEYHKLRALSIKIVRHIGIVGECNVQYAFDPQSEDYRVIEVNARLSRSSALASKATGYPLAFVAAKLGMGYGLFELKNSVTKTTSAFFEPALDYVVCKIPRWDLSKFRGVDKELGSSMKSVGEVMAIGRNFEEAIQKGLRMIGQGMHGFVENKELEIPDIDAALREPTDKRVFVISKAMHKDYTVDQIHELTKIDKWFLQKLKHIIDIDETLKKRNVNTLDKELLRTAKVNGFTDFQIARAVGLENEIANMHRATLVIRNLRKNYGILPVVKQIDTLAAEYPAQTNYLYVTYAGVKSDVASYNDKRSVIVLGSGAYRIGSSVEFDWCGVQALNSIRKEGYRSIMINYNPETVSTDYDMCDRLYFDELTFERVMDIIEWENPYGVVVSTGGQIPNNLAMWLDAANVPILGTAAKDIDNAEDRAKFSAMLTRLGINQPEWSALTSMSDIDSFVARVGFPVLVRPSYVLSGAAMNVCSNADELGRFLRLAANVSEDHPVVVSKFIENAKEIEMDAVARNGEIMAYAISEHIEFAGVHSGDATIQFPPQKLYVETVRRIKRVSRQIASALHINGPFNIQFMARENDILVIECNLRASRSFPFVSKVLKLNLIELATKIMLGLPVEKPNKNLFDLDYVGIKASQFSFNRLQKADPVLGVDMSSTGEVGCLGDDTNQALLKSMLSVGHRIPKHSVLLSTGGAKQKAEMLDAAKMLKQHGYELYATGGTSKYLDENGVENTRVYWPSDENCEPQALTLMRDRRIDMVVNIPKDLTPRELTNGYKIRRTAIDLNIPLITNSRLASAFITAFCTLRPQDIDIKAWGEY
ncbi:carbamoyl-phosphate synthase (glutamine-hydrolyzing) large subunit [Prevotella sp. kh1p2]|uniref:carbamoyl-phosphate synthase (glutamine-hydrolyzing) large subunit n=1 Tax=Prevotella sp. kh1p2 TaxID=1761883 RepID=UPI0008C8F1ED|nr:carbamoyl-phosphate synthase (glutamine-hydrolyzing) large subunit [Prevotella sp. kh1p2]SET07097.1 carbamoyl-phosphate synthase large subunit [Prevotella sp. kh1p2]SNU10907.1 carbamoyl-phosphate synthase large subunit [Prevotellaceae bacterium KH2P17]